MMILWISCMFWVSLCAAQNNMFSQATAGSSPFSSGGLASASGGQFNRMPQSPFSGVSASSSAGPSGTSASAQVVTPAAYPACLASKPDDAVTSASPFAYSLLEGSFTNPFLKTFYNTSFDTSVIYGTIYDELQETLPNVKSMMLAGSLAFLLENAFPRITPLLNAVSITNAINAIQTGINIVIADDKEEYIEPFLTSISKAVSGSDGSAEDQAQALVSGLLGYLDQINVLQYSKLHEFISILAGEYSLAIYSTCKPSSFEVIPKD